MEITLIEKRKLGKSDAIIPAMDTGTIVWTTSKVLSILILVAFIFAGCERHKDEVIPTIFFTNQSSSNQTGVVYGENIDVLVQGSGSLVLSGTCNFAEITVQSSGSFIGSVLEIRGAEVNIRGSGHIYIWVTDRLIINIQGSGNVYYKGNPQISSNIQGSGRLIKM